MTREFVGPVWAVWECVDVSGRVSLGPVWAVWECVDVSGRVS